MITCQGWEKHVRRSEVIRSTVRLNPPSGGSTTLQARAPPNLPHHPIFSEKSEPIFFLLSHVLFRVSQPQPSAIDIGLQSCSPHLSRSAKRANRFTYVILVSVRSELFVKMHLINRYLRSVMSQFHSQGPIQDSDWETQGGGGDQKVCSDLFHTGFVTRYVPMRCLLHRTRTCPQIVQGPPRTTHLQSHNCQQTGQTCAPQDPFRNFHIQRHKGTLSKKVNILSEQRSCWPRDKDTPLCGSFAPETQGVCEVSSKL